MSSEHDTRPPAQPSLPEPNEDAAATQTAIQDVRSLNNRTPRPYFRDGDHVQQDGVQIPLLDVSSGDTDALSGVVYREWHQHEGSESGTEADDERPHFVKTLPPATLRPRKGLKTGESNAEILLTPSQLDPDGRSIQEDYWGMSIPDTQKVQSLQEESDMVQEKLRRRRLAEFARRSSEVALVGVMAMLVFCGDAVASTAKPFGWALLCHVSTVAGLVLAYPVKLSIVDTQATHSKLWQRFRVPASFDPATVLYPPLLPLLVALTISPVAPQAILPNIILGLCCLPQRLFPRSSRLGGFNSVHWLISTLPVYAYQFGLKLTNTPDTILGISTETLVSLYPLHHALMAPLFYVTQTSLLVSELHLLSVALINLLILSQAPQAVILKTCLWIGGVPLLALCGAPLRWNITLTRVPKWKFRRPGQDAQPRRSLMEAVSTLIKAQRAAIAFQRGTASDSEGDDPERPRMPLTDFSRSVMKSLQNGTTSTESKMTSPRRWNSGRRPRVPTAPETARPRRNTLPSHSYISTRASPRRANRVKSGSSVHWCLRLTTDQAQHRKWMYAGYFYLTAVCLILGPVQYYVYKHALALQNPILWAIGYMAGQLPYVTSILSQLGLEPQRYVSMPAMRSWHEFWSYTWLRWPLDVDDLRLLLGAANVRLLLVVYWSAVLLVGLLTVFSLTAYVEVDTRRKVFHGVMVAMFLPSIFVDPCCCALALTLVLAVFLLLEVVRAGQVVPLGNRIGHFIAPYVDGRDLRGPVVVSHIFLLIGCAVPLWFSLAAILRTDGDDEWAGWELLDQQRDVAMVAGVICVGMGDAAASLIGRRYGRHKWPWVGGKSLEGSGAFALAVTIGLLAAKLWLAYGGWMDAHDRYNPGWVQSWTMTTFKAIVCACGASFMEAVLTGANDNVVVPIALWLLVKGCRL